MGDRGNIVMRDQHGDCEVYLYSHWGGTELPTTLKAGLIAGCNRWTDGPYLARIIFATMTKGQEDGRTGFGISTSISDNEYPFLVVDPGTETVTVRDLDGTDTAQVIPFGDYVSLSWGWDDDEEGLVSL